MAQMQGVKQESSTPGFPVQPTGLQQTTQYSDTAMMSLFNAHVSMINTATTAIWQRYNVMLLANAIVFSFLDKRRDLLPLGVGFGLLLCCAWWAMTSLPWKLLNMRQDLARQFSFGEFGVSANPVEVGFNWREGTRRGRTYRVAVLVIWLFMGAYLALLANHLSSVL